jgi:hypothetical protein
MPEPMPLSICAIIRDEAPYIAEWIEFHRLVGVSRFYLYDDGSVDDTVAIVGARDHGDIVLHRTDDRWRDDRFCGPHDESLRFGSVPQCRAYNHCAATYRDVGWIAYIDADEFLYHIQGIPVNIILSKDVSRTGVVVNWLIFGSSGHATRPPGLTLAAYTHRAPNGQPEPYGRHVNSSYSYLWGLQGSHMPTNFYPARDPVTQDGVPNPWAFTKKYSNNGLVLNHYYHRSVAEAAAKVARDDHNAPPGLQPTAARLAAHDRNEVLDCRILQYLPRLMSAMKEPA